MSGTSMAAPVVSGAAALLLQLNPNLTPQMVKMILQYSAQQLAGFDTLEQGAGSLNIEGALRLASSYDRRLLFSASITQGTRLLKSGLRMPEARSTVGGTDFEWAQGILFDHGIIKGRALADTFQNIYRNGRTFNDAVSIEIGRAHV